MSQPESNRSVNRAALSSMIGLLLLLAAGASVNSLGAALSVPDWPLSYGKLLPFNFTGNATHEQAHRILAVVCAALMLWLGVALWRHERRRWVRTIGVTAVGLYLAQVLMGGLVVLWLSPKWLAALHAVLAQVTFVLVFVLVLVTSRRWVEDGGGEPLPAAGLIAAIAWLTLLQIVLGATSRHPPFGQGPFIATLLTHIALALTLLGLAVALVVKLARHDAPRKLKATATALLVLLLVQLLIGLPLFVVSPEPLAGEWDAPRSFSYLHIAHVVMAALIFAHAAALAVRVRRRAG